ncbi:MAG: type II toxin-antitoxin system HicB family antitoxin [Anaerolineales bacterium]|jgi:predicted RNase H-like HicB family nuclease
MHFRLAVEDIETNHWVVYALDVPGCFSSAQYSEEAIAQASVRIAEHLVWLSKHDISFLDADTPIEVEVVE